MKIIFLDIDGVLNSVRTMHANEVDRSLALDFRKSFLISMADPIAVKLLNRITDETGAKIVVSSTNRIDLGLRGCTKVLRQIGVTGDIIDVTEHLNAKRGAEIKEWLSRHEVESYIIIDDDSDMLEEQLDNFVHTNGQIGLDHNDKDLAIKILSGQEPSLIIVVKEKE